MTDVFSRRELLAGSAALVLAAGSPALAQTAPDKLNVGKAVFSSFPFAALEVGMDAGIWKSLNLDVEGIAFKGDFARRIGAECRAGQEQQCEEQRLHQTSQMPTDRRTARASRSTLAQASSSSGRG